MSVRDSTGEETGADYSFELAGLQLRFEEASVAAQLLHECEAMETEIAMLKNKRSPVEVRSLSSFASSQLS